MYMEKNATTLTPVVGTKVYQICILNMFQTRFKLNKENVFSNENKIIVII